MVSVEGLAIRLGEFAHEGTSLTVREGDYFCLIGPTGAGKTVLIESIAGLQRPQAGRITIEGRDVTELPPHARGVGYVPQDYALFPHMDVAANIAYGLVERRTAHMQIQAKVQETAELLGIGRLLHRRPLTLSGGERQRVALARALVLGCKLLLMDEPFGALDQVTKATLFPMMTELRDRMGLTILHVTHDFSEAYALADRVGVIHGGRLLQVGTVEEVFTAPRSRTVAAFTGMGNIWEVPRVPSSADGLLGSVITNLGLNAAGGQCVCIRPDGISISQTPQPEHEFGARGSLRQVRWMGPVHELHLGTGPSLVATIGTREYRRLGCRLGDTLYIGFDRSAVHVIDAP
jgi:molybdate transport system ATP-binding protein